MFAKGLCEKHFDIFCQHFEQTLRDRAFGDAIVEQVMTVLRPLRDVFQEVSEKCQHSKDADDPGDHTQSK